VSTTPKAGAPTRRRGRPPAADSEATRERILHSARLRFGRDGYGHTSMEHIADDAGVTPRALYHYYDSKQDLFAAAARSSVDRFTAEIADRVLPATTTRERLKVFIQVYRDLYAEDPTLLSFASVASIESSRDPDLPNPFADDDGRDLLAALVDEAIRTDELADGVGRGAAITLLEVMGVGMTLLAANEDVDDYPGMLDALERLVDGTLFTT
jgi:AcrR family transcriptional regulator